MPEHIKELIVIAEIYFEDGAPATAAARLRAAADEMQVLADQRQRALEELTQ